MNPCASCVVDVIIIIAPSALEIQKQEPGRTPDEAYITFKLSYVKTDNKGKPDQQGSKAPPAASSSSPLSSLANMFGGGGGKKAAPAEEVTERVEKSRFIRDKKGRYVSNRCTDGRDGGAAEHGRPWDVRSLGCMSDRRTHTSPRAPPLAGGTSSTARSRARRRRRRRA